MVGVGVALGFADGYEDAGGANGVEPVREGKRGRVKVTIQQRVVDDIGYAK